MRVKELRKLFLNVWHTCRERESLSTQIELQKNLRNLVNMFIISFVNFYHTTRIEYRNVYGVLVKAATKANDGALEK
jgi:hypothetical protein